MKKLLLAFLLLINITTVYALENENCKSEDILTYMNEVKDITFNYTVMPKGTIVEDFYTLEDTDVSYKIQVEVSNLPSDDYYVVLGNSDYMRSLYEDTPIIVDSGVYSVTIYKSSCGLDVIKEYEIMIPYYNPENKNVWFDGTYEQTSNNYNDTTSKISKKLIIVLVSLIIIIVSAIIIIVVVRKRHNYE